MKCADEACESPEDRRNWSLLIESAAKEVFELMLGAELKPATGDIREEFDITAMVGFAGQLRGVLTVRCNHDTAVRMASKMLGIFRPAAKQDVKDAFGEVGNMIAGNLKNKISGAGDACMLSVPTVIAGSDYSVHSLADSGAVEVRQMFEGSPVLLALQIHS